MSEPLKALLNYGTAGAVLAVILAVFVWAFKKMLDRFFSERDDFKVFMRDIVDAIQKIAINCGACRMDGMASTSDSSHNIRAEIVQAANKISGDVVAARDKVIENIWAAAGKTIEQVDDLEKEVSRPYRLRAEVEK